MCLEIIIKVIDIITLERSIYNLRMRFLYVPTFSPIKNNNKYDSIIIKYRVKNITII